MIKHVIRYMTKPTTRLIGSESQGQEEAACTYPA